MRDHFTSVSMNRIQEKNRTYYVLAAALKQRNVEKLIYFLNFFAIFSITGRCHISLLCPWVGKMIPRAWTQQQNSPLVIGLPSALAYVVTIVEIADGWAMMLGLGTRLMAAAFAIIIIGAIVTVKADAGLLGNGRETGYAFNLSLLAMSVHLWLNGSRLWSLDALVRRPRD